MCIRACHPDCQPRPQPHAAIWAVWCFCGFCRFCRVCGICRCDIVLVQEIAVQRGCTAWWEWTQPHRPTVLRLETTTSTSFQSTCMHTQQSKAIKNFEHKIRHNNAWQTQAKQKRTVERTLIKYAIADRHPRPLHDQWWCFSLLHQQRKLKQAALHARVEQKEKPKKRSTARQAAVNTSGKKAGKCKAQQIEIETANGNQISHTRPELLNQSIDLTKKNAKRKLSPEIKYDSYPISGIKLD